MAWEYLDRYKTISEKGTNYFGRPLGLILIISYKAIWGMVEIITGILVYFSYGLLMGELAEDPQDFLANWILTNLHLTPTESSYSIFLIIFGLLKIILAAALWLKFWFIRELGIAVFSILAAFGIFQVSSHFSWFAAAALVADAVFLYYFIFVLPKHIRHATNPY